MGKETDLFPAFIVCRGDFECLFHWFFLHLPYQPKNRYIAWTALYFFATFVEYGIYAWWLYLINDLYGDYDKVLQHQPFLILEFDFCCILNAIQFKFIAL